jgi:putative ABC transport system permease protein
MATKGTFTSLIGLFVVMIASIGILNLQLMAVFERTREMGVLAAMGMKGRQIMGIFLLEGTLIGVVGAVIGCLLGVASAGCGSGAAGGVDLSFAAGMGEDIMALMGSRLYPATTPASVIARGAIVVVIAALASLYPAWQASRKEPAAALHHV